jgi:hypothetical protein
VVKAGQMSLFEQLPRLRKADARRLTDEIRKHVSEAWTLLAEAHERQAWKVLGYPTWEEYVRTEFNMSRSRSYQILDHAKMTRELVSASGVSTSVDISEAAARELKGRQHEVITRINHRLAEASPDADEVEIVNQVVTEFREELQGRTRRMRSSRVRQRSEASGDGDLLDQFREELQAAWTLLSQMGETQRLEAHKLLSKLMDDYNRAYSGRQRKRIA